MAFDLVRVPNLNRFRYTTLLPGPHRQQYQLCLQVVGIDGRALCTSSTVTCVHYDSKIHYGNTSKYHSRCLRARGHHSRHRLPARRRTRPSLGIGHLPQRPGRNDALPEFAYPTMHMADGRENEGGKFVRVTECWWMHYVPNRIIPPSYCIFSMVQFAVALQLRRRAHCNPRISRHAAHNNST